MKRKSTTQKPCGLNCIDARGKPRYMPADSKHTACSVCRANLAYWTRQPTARRLLRTNRVRLYVRRMEELE